MLRITAKKIAQLFPERYPGEHSELQDSSNRDAQESQWQSQQENYFRKVTYSDGRSEVYPDGNVTLEEAMNVSPEDLQSEKELGAVEIEVVDREGNHVEMIWNPDLDNGYGNPNPMPTM